MFHKHVRRGLGLGGAVAVAAMAASLGGCSFSSGGGGDPPPAKIIIMPSGQAVSCQDGTSQPCPH